MFDYGFSRKGNWFPECGAAVRDHEEQDMLTAAFSHDEVTEMIASGQIKDAPTIAALGLLATLEAD